MLELFKRLSEAHGLSGREEGIAGVIRKEIEPYVDEILEDTMGNLVGVKKGSGFTVMLAAHMDEIGLMVKFIDEKGFISFVTLGSFYPPTLAAQRVILSGSSGPVRGVVGGKPPHKMDDDERKKGVKIDDMFIDVGASSREEVIALGIDIGTPITIDRDFHGLSNGRVTGKAFDNRAGVLVLIEVLKRIETSCTVYAVFTAQEEVGLKGAKTSAYLLKPDCAIATDVTIPGDHPGIEKKDAPVEMGKGPVITIVDSSGRGLIADRRIVKWLQNAAKSCDVPVQMEVGSGGTTDATTIHLERGGIPSTTVSIATRYIHSPVEVLDMKDIEYAVRMIVEALKTPPKI